MTVILLCVLLSILCIFYALCRRATRTSIAQIPGPEPESFLLGIVTSPFHPLIVGLKRHLQETYASFFKVKPQRSILDAV
jgi:hypothetical protein